MIGIALTLLPTKTLIYIHTSVPSGRPLAPWAGPCSWPAVVADRPSPSAVLPASADGRQRRESVFSRSTDSGATYGSVYIASCPSVQAAIPRLLAAIVACLVDGRTPVRRRAYSGRATGVHASADDGCKQRANRPCGCRCASVPADKVFVSLPVVNRRAMLACKA